MKMSVCQIIGEQRKFCGYCFSVLSCRFCLPVLQRLHGSVCLMSFRLMAAVVPMAYWHSASVAGSV